jgi:hypothetical protein
MSGGRTTLKNRKIKQVAMSSTQAGDFDGNSPEGQEFTRAFYCDSKHLADLQIRAWVYQRQGICVKSIDPVWIEARQYKRIPLGAFREDRSDDLVLTSPVGHSVFDEAYRTLKRNENEGIPYLNQFFRDIDYPTDTKGGPKLVRRREMIYVHRLSCLLNYVSWAMVRRVLIDRRLLVANKDIIMPRPITGPSA